MKRGDFVTDATASPRHYPSVYRLLQPYGKQWLVEHVGDVVGGRLQFSSRRGDQSYRLETNLREWRSQ